MKTINYLPVVLAALAFNSGSIALGQIIEESSTVLEHKLTIALTASEEVENEDKVTNKTTTSSSSIVKSKISNKNILDIFVELGLIEEIKGWSIVGISYDDEGDLEGVYLVKGEDFIDVSEYFDIDFNETDVESYKTVYQNESESYKGSYSEFEQAEVDFECEIEEGVYIEIDLDAIANQKGSYSYDSEEDEYTDVLTSLEFEHGIGDFYDEQEESNGLVRGSYKFGKGTESVIVEEMEEVIID